MKQTERTRFLVADNSGAKLLSSFSSYNNARIGDMITASVKKVDPGSKNIKKGQIVKAIVVATKNRFKRSNDTFIRYSENYAVIFDKGQLMGTRIFIPLLIEFSQWGYKEFLSKAPQIL